jgi:cation diffusion facilitator family transporter
MELNHRNNQFDAVRKVLWRVLFANLVITVIKISLGIITGALAVVADGFHSLVDSSSNLIGLAVIKLAAQPADESHPYGYQKYETLGALGIGALLLVAAWEIIQNVFSRFFGGGEPEITLLTFVLVVLTLPVNLIITVLETSAGKRLNSEILLADATHTRSDLYITASVIASLVGSWLGWRWVDWIVALGVVGLILRAAFGILRDAVGSLADVVGIEPKEIEKITLGVPGVRKVHNARSRGTSDAIFVDLHVKVEPAMSTSQAHAVASEVERRICSEFKNVVDAVVHIEPAHLEETDDWDKISYGLRQIADGMGLGLHDLHVHVTPDGDYIIEVHLEIGGGLSLGEAHHLADQFEDRALNYWPRAICVHTHLEPISENLIYRKEGQDIELIDKVTSLLSNHADVEKLIEVQANDLGGHKRITLELMMASDISLMESHKKTEQIKRMLFEKIPEIERLMVHVEPSE